MLVFQDLEGLTEVFGRVSAGISGPKLPLWADFSFLISVHGSQGVFIERGPFFRGKGASRASQIPHGPTPPPTGPSPPPLLGDPHWDFQ